MEYVSFPCLSICNLLITKRYSVTRDPQSKIFKSDRRISSGTAACRYIFMRTSLSISLLYYLQASWLLGDMPHQIHYHSHISFSPVHFLSLLIAGREFQIFFYKPGRLKPSTHNLSAIWKVHIIFPLDSHKWCKVCGTIFLHSRNLGLRHCENETILLINYCCNNINNFTFYNLLIFFLVTVISLKYKLIKNLF